MSDEVERARQPAATVALRRRGSDTLPPEESTLPSNPTRVDGPRPAADSAAPGAAITPADALYRDEARGTQIFALFVVVLVVLVAVVLQLIGGDPTARWIHIGGLGIAAGTAVWIAASVRRVEDYQPLHAIVFGEACVIAVATGFVYWGVLSAALMVVPFGAFFFSVGQSFRIALLITLSCVGAHLLLALCTIFGVIPDRGVVRSILPTTTSNLAVLVLVHFVFFATFVVARGLRTSSLRSLGELDDAVRALAQREALLAEAKQELDQALRIGQPGRYTNQLIGGYRLGVVIGRGALGAVYEAQHLGTGREAAVKLLHPHTLADPGHLKRFFREARIVSSIQEPHIVSVYDVPSGDDSLPYIAMERLRGHSLAELLKAHPTIDPADVVALLRQVGAGLAAAHAHGIVHRDLKPHNLFCVETEAGERIWKILDFGVCKLSDDSGTLTKDHLVGTPAYMAPEQASGKSVDQRADLYSLGVIAYRALTGRPAVVSGDIPQQLYDVVYRQPPRPSTIRPLPRDVDYVMAIAMAKKPRDRFDSGVTMAEALRAALAGELDEALRQRGRALADALPWASAPFERVEPE